MSQTATFRLTGRHVLLALVGFFAVIIGVNATFITLAARSFPGITTEQPFKRGLAPNFNRTLAERADQDARGWTAGLAHEWDRTGETARFTLEVVDADGARVPDLVVTAELRRAVTDREDRDVRFLSGADGAYAATVAGVSEGAWDLIIRTTFPDGAPFEATERVWLR